METRVLTGSGIYFTAAIWGLSSLWLPSMLIPAAIIMIPKIGIEIYKGLSA